jgi:predicted dehydrogenase
MMADRTLRWGMIGTGNVTERKSGPAFSKVPGSRLVAVANRTFSKAEDYARRHDVPSLHREPLDLIRDPEVDLVYVATPPDAHPQYALACISAGKPVYIEKPMALTHARCMEINAAAERKGVPVYVAYYRRALPYFLQVKELLEKGRLGRILHVNMQQYFPSRPEDHEPSKLPWRVIPEISGGGYFHDMGCHALDILFFLIGDPLSVYGRTANLGGLYEPPDTITALLTLPAGIPLTASWSFVTPLPFSKDLVEIFGTNGKMKFSVFSFDPIRLILEDGEQTFTPEQPGHIQQPLIRSIIEEQNGRGRCPSTGSSATVTSLVMDRICGNAENGK